MNNEIQSLTSTKQELQDNITTIQNQMTIIKKEKQTFQQFTREITDDDFWNIPEPSTFMNAKSYHKKIVIPFINGIKTTINRMIKKYLNLLHEVDNLKTSVLPLKMKIRELNTQIDQLFDRNRHLEKTLQKYKKY
ncbi:hypothetical protein [Longibaculum muris]|uniref:hypothetical protein n=1 Tax=Longibaculum muris TaxID=1796628 RepID=UPI0012B7FEB5|nr:hypothetical protein [Longibaculum muris]